MGLKLHIGCGGQILPGYINIDEMDARADVRLGLQSIEYPPNSVERIEGYMVLEHLNPDDAKIFLRKAYKMLQPGGVLILEVPDLQKVSRLILAFADDPSQLQSGPFGLRGIFGEPTPGMTLADHHKWGYTPPLAIAMFKEAGFDNPVVSDGMSHCYPLRDMRIEATK
jgi:hypothetical protein